MNKLLISSFSVALALITLILVGGCIATRNSSIGLSDSTDNPTISRGKRYLDFVISSRMFFRANVKNNILKANQLWAFAYGYRANYPIENDIKPKKPIRREVFQALEDLMDSHGFDGRACVLKSFCTASYDMGSSGINGMLLKLLQMIFTLSSLFVMDKFKRVSALIGTRLWASSMLHTNINNSWENSRLASGGHFTPTFSQRKSYLD